MSGCRSCTDCSSDRNYQPVKNVEKLEKSDRSCNPRYPHVFVGKQAIYSDENCQVIVTVLTDACDEAQDRFILRPQRILKDLSDHYTTEQTFQVSQPAGEHHWKLQALI